VSGRHGLPPRRSRAAVEFGPDPAAGASPLARPAPASSGVTDHPIFRAEALQSYAGFAQSPDALIRLGKPWLRWLYGMALALLVAGIALVATVRTTQDSYGTAVVTEPSGRFAALLPIAVISDLIHAKDPQVELQVSGSERLTVLGAKLQLADDRAVRQAGLVPPTQASLLLTGWLAAGFPKPACGSAGGCGRVVTPVALVLKSARVGSIVVREFEVMLGQREAGA
jgi:hypothetical protein